MLPDQDGHHHHDENHEYNYAAEGSGVLLVLLCLLQLLESLLGVVDDLLHVEVDSIKYSTLINHEYSEFFEYLRQLLD